MFCWIMPTEIESVGRPFLRKAQDRLKLRATIHSINDGIYFYNYC